MFINWSHWDKAKLAVETVTTRPLKESCTSCIKVSYDGGQVPVFAGPVSVCDWPMLGSDGNMGTLYGPIEEGKAQWQVSLTDRCVPQAPCGTSLNSADGRNPLAQSFFQVIKDIDEVVCEYVYERRGELLGQPNLTKEQVQAKMKQSVKVKCDDAGKELYQKMSVSLKKYGCDGNKNELVVIKCKERWGGEIKHEDVLMVKLQLDCVCIIGTGSFDAKYSIIEINHVAHAVDEPPSKKARVDDAMSSVLGSIAR